MLLQLVSLTLWWVTGTEHHNQSLISLTNHLKLEMSQLQKAPTFSSDMPPEDQEGTEYDEWVNILVSILLFFLLKPSLIQIPVTFDFEKAGKRKRSLVSFFNQKNNESIMSFSGFFFYCSLSSCQ